MRNEGEMAGMKGKMEGMKGIVAGMKRKMEGMKGILEGMQGKMGGMKGKIERMKGSTRQVVNFPRGSRLAVGSRPSSLQLPNRK